MEMNGTKRDLQNNSEIQELINFVATAVVGGNPSAKQKQTIRQIETLIYSLRSAERDNEFDRNQSQLPFVRNERDRTLRKKYNITLADWEVMFLAQSSACAICKCTNPGRAWHTDHCHKSGIVRGILCGDCNKGIGHFRDDPRIDHYAV